MLIYWKLSITTQWNPLQFQLKRIELYTAIHCSWSNVQCGNATPTVHTLPWSVDKHHAGTIWNQVTIGSSVFLVAPDTKKLAIEIGVHEFLSASSNFKTAWAGGPKTYWLSFLVSFKEGSNKVPTTHKLYITHTQQKTLWWNVH